MGRNTRAIGPDVHSLSSSWGDLVPRVLTAQHALWLQFKDPSVEARFRESQRDSLTWRQGLALCVVTLVQLRSVVVASGPALDGDGRSLTVVGGAVLLAQGGALLLPRWRGYLMPGPHMSLLTTAGATLLLTGSTSLEDGAAQPGVALTTVPALLSSCVVATLPLVGTPFTAMVPLSAWLFCITTVLVTRLADDSHLAAEALVGCVFVTLAAIVLRQHAEQGTRALFASQQQMEGIGAHAKRATERLDWFRRGANALAVGPPMIDASEINFLEAIGAGGFGDVMRAQWQSMTVAVKILRADVTKDVMHEFGGEAAIMAAVRHPHIVLFLGISLLPSGSCALVLEFMENGSLYNVLHQRQARHAPLHWTLRVRMALDAALGLKHLHHAEPRIIHGDVKSHNLLVNKDWHLKVSDFGVSRLQQLVAAQEAEASLPQQQQQQLDGEDNSMSRRGASMRHMDTVAASIAWSAPEILSGSAAPSEASDVYSFGITLFELVYYQVPYRNKPMYNIPLCVLEGQRPHHFEALPDELPPALEDVEGVMLDCLEGDPLARPSFSDLVLALRSVGAHEAAGDGSGEMPAVQLPGEAASAANARLDLSGFSLTAAELIMGPSIGRGSFGEVFEGLYHGTHVAIKRLFMQGTSLTPQALQAFHRECEIMQQLRHPNIVLFMGTCVSDTTLCMVTELMAHGSLYFLYHSTSMQDVGIGDYPFVDVVLRVAHDASRGIAYLHSRTPKMIHRDLKSPNILIDESWTSKIADFGLSRIIEGDGSTMTTVGSPLWVAPEVLRHERVNELCDIYSLGIIFWELYHWREPYPGLTVMNVIQGVAHGDTRPEIENDCPPAFSRLMQQMWHADADKRPGAETVLSRLGKIRSAALRRQRQKVVPAPAAAAAPTAVAPADRDREELSGGSGSSSARRDSAPALRYESDQGQELSSAITMVPEDELRAVENL